MLSVTCKSFILRVVMLSVAMLSVTAHNRQYKHAGAIETCNVTAVSNNWGMFVTLNNSFLINFNLNLK